MKKKKQNCLLGSFEVLGTIHSPLKSFLVVLRWELSKHRTAAVYENFCREQDLRRKFTKAIEIKMGDASNLVEIREFVPLERKRGTIIYSISTIESLFDMLELNVREIVRVLSTRDLRSSALADTK